MPVNLSDFDSTKCPDFTPNQTYEQCQYFDEAKQDSECGFCKKPEYYRCLAHKGQIPLSHSSVQNFLTCHHLYYLSAIRGIQVRDAAKSSPLKMGTLWDAVLQKHLGGIDRETGKPFDIPAIINRYEIDARDVAKVRGIYRAYKTLEIQVDPGFELQSKIDLKIDFGKNWGIAEALVEILVTGFYDRKYPTYFVENKFSSRPDNYLDPWFIQSQVGTYFLADPSLEFCIMEIVRTPDLKSTGKNKEEDPETYCERVCQDAISRPSHYFIGWDPKTRRYGKKFFRAEFQLDEIRDRFIHVFLEYHEARLFNGFYKNDRVCSNVLPGIKCDMLPVCRYNTMSETMYQIRKPAITF